MNDLFFFLRFHRSHFHHCRVVSLLAYIESSRYRERLCWFFCVFNICFKVFIFMQVNMVWSAAMVRHTSHAHCTVHSWKWWRQNYCNKITFFNTNRCIAFIAILRRNCVFMTIYDFIFWILIIIIIEEVGAADIFIEYSLFYWKNHFASVRIGSHSSIGSGNAFNRTHHSYWDNFLAKKKTPTNYISLFVFIKCYLVRYTNVDEGAWNKPIYTYRTQCVTN